MDFVKADSSNLPEIDFLTIMEYLKGRDEYTAAEIRQEKHESDYVCGLGSWQPGWLQKFATSKYFLLVYGMLGTVQAMSFVYFIGTLTTIERRFGIQSKTTGWMLSGNEVSQILLSPFLSYYGGQRNRPVWIAWGVTFSALSCYVLASPHWFFGAGTDALSLTMEYGAMLDASNHSLAHKREQAGLCSSEPKTQDCSDGSENFWAPLLIFISQFILGIGTTLYYSLGQPYIDDNSKKANTPMLLGLTMALRTLGPSFGFVVTYFCLSLYIDPSLTPTIGSKDPRWLGAWWLGWVILGSVMLLHAGLIAFFPKKLPKRRPPPPALHPTEEPLNRKVPPTLPPQQIEDSKPPPQAKDFVPALMKLLRNKILIVNIFSGVFYILGGSGYITYMTKNMEVQWYETSAKANVILGPVILGAMVAGFVVSGWAISRFKPRPFYLLGWNVIVGMVYVFSEILFIFLACPDIDIVGYDPNTKSLNFINECNYGCGCAEVKFSPVCLNGSSLTFFSPCHAGCTLAAPHGSSGYSNCSCIPTFNSGVTIPGIQDYRSLEYQTYAGTVTDGYCLPDCFKLRVIYILFSFAMQFLGSTGKIGNVLVNYRAVDPGEKSFAAGISLFLISLVAFIPGPIIYGYILDSTCLIWDQSCGREGNCWFYDRANFRLYLNGTAAVFTSIGALLDLWVCFLGRDLHLYDEEGPPKSAITNDKDPPKIIMNSVKSQDSLPEKPSS